MNLEQKLIEAKQVLETRKAEYWGQLGVVHTLETLLKEEQENGSKSESRSESAISGDSGGSGSNTN